ncbi:hypothetical protein JAAARDRAFT_509522 [Jaapia argillacea MUCL 33604]|uniref:F-box domain-containing protein n=1 Tax=Jaapia argillacea MUCL 33604 TaxID=933084 RepID=A0A067QFQ7_9AGAM|nr:hypothetical protein JAAARDRAFT_509522 [Jaapia argillacea MUCL 33604]
MATPQRHASDSAEPPLPYQAEFSSNPIGQVALAQPPSPAIHTSPLQKMAQHMAFIFDANHQSDPDIAAHLESVRRLRTKRNSLVPISRLPPEVLVNIFGQHASRSDISLGFALGCSRSTVWWIAITHVCQYWREVALATPSLWCSLPFQRPRWVPEMISRSQMAPLQVTVASESSEFLPQIRMALEHMPRIRILGLELRTSDLRTLPLSSPAPLLHTLKLFNRIIQDPFPIPEDAFNLVTPSLRRLDLTGCTPSWDSPMFKGLTCLSLNTKSGPESGRPSFSGLFEILGNNPQLESLTLINCLSPTTSDSRPRNSTILLPMLATFHLEDDALRCSLLISSLSVPPTMALKLSSFASTSSRDTSLFASIRTLGLSISIVCLNLSLFWASVTLKGYDRPIPSSIHSDPTLPPPPRIEICLGLSEDPSEPRVESAESILTQGFSLMDLTCLEELFANTALSASTGAMRESWWRGLFEKLPRVKSLAVFGSSACLEVLAALGKGVQSAKTGLETAGTGNSVTMMASSSSRMSPTPDSRAGNPILLPNLRTFSIHDADLEEHFYRSGAHGPTPLIAFLMKTLAWRKTAGKRVETLVLEKCWHIHQDAVDRIGEAVANVDWDKIDLAEDEDESDGGGHFYRGTSWQ